MIPPTFPDLVTVGDLKAWAVFDQATTRRYLLGRYWYDAEDVGTQPIMVFGMCNPSQAGVEDDPTIRKCIGFAKKYKCAGILAVNATPWIATDPRDLRNFFGHLREDRNDEMIAWAFRTPALGVRVAAWGHLAFHVRRQVGPSLSWMKQCGALWSFGTTKDGSPRHPLMLAYATPLTNLVDGRAW